MNKQNKYSEIINGIMFQTIDKEVFKMALKNYADDTEYPAISVKDFNQIYHLQTIKPEYIKQEALKRLSHKTIINTWKNYWKREL